MASTIARLAFALVLFGCLDPDDGQDPPSTSAEISAVSSTTMSSAEASFISEGTYWRCRGTGHYHRTPESCAAVCTVACRQVDLCTLPNGTPVPCP